jgi:hypothetical protein
MRTWILAAVIAVATIGSIFLAGGMARAAPLESIKITEVNIAEIKGQLKLTTSQQALWERVEAVLVSIAREQAQDESTGLLHRISRRVVSIAVNSAVTQRVTSAALPLLASLDEEQKTTARKIAQRIGLGPMLAMSN